MSQKKKSGTSLLYQLIGEARGYDDAIIMGRGDPDFDTPPHIVAAAKEAMIHHHNDYSPPQGLLPLRQAIAERVKRVNNIDVDPESEVVVTNGGQEALFLMVLAVTSPGDEMIVPEPNYNTYADSLAFAGGVKVEVQTYAETDFRADPGVVRQLITDKTRSLLLVSPNNPAASVISPSDMREMLDIAIERDLMILADDIYDLFVYDDFQHVSPASLPGGKERALTLNALSKSYSMTGWRLGWIVGPADLMARVAELKAAISGGTSVISQYAGIAALTGPQDAVEMMAEAYRKRRRMVLDALDEMGMQYGMPQGGQFVFADIGFTGLDSAEVAQRMLTEQHVLAYPGSAFSKDRKDYLRMTFLQPEDQLLEGLERMKVVMDNIMAEKK
ncbi:MAG: aminotransferase class I/II-fold pyridoxal phosphate-dependent enzyme [Chloroflexota bacterium]|nr:aminotransferase class I/II-fold pyridoxal phosphate-dependent enzyme [Chloroflexota bacterium]